VVEPSAEHARARFDEAAPDYDRYVRAGEWLALRRLRRRLLRHAGGTVLEVGVGTGLNLPHYPEGVRLFGVDLSEGRLARAQARADALGLEVQLNLMDAAALPFPDRSFDTVASALTLCSPADPGAVLDELRRVCKPEGRLLLLEHGRGRFRWLNRWLDRRAPDHWDEWACHPNRDMVNIVRDAGVRIERVEARLFGYVTLFWGKP